MYVCMYVSIRISEHIHSTSELGLSKVAKRPTRVTALGSID